MYIPMEYTRTASSLLAIAVITLGSHFQCINATINDDHDVGGRKVPDGLDFDIGLGKDWTEDVLDRLAIYPSKTCSDQYEVKTKKIIRTEDSLQNNAEFVDAVISETFQNCFDACCSHDQECDTTVYIQGDRDSDENCFLFRCWFDDEQRCFFSSHEGYISSMIGGFANPRFSAYLQSNKQAADDTRTMYPEDDYNDGNEKQERPISPKKATTLPPVTMKLQSTTPSSDVKTYGKTTSTLKKPVGEQVCMTTQYKCPISRECIIKRLVCDNIPDCLDGSDEQGCNKESPDPHNDPEIPSHSLVTMAPPAPVQLQDGVVVDTNPKDSTLPPKPPPPTNKVEPNPKDLKGHGQSDRTNKEHGQESSVSRVEAGQVEIPTGALFPLIVGLLLTMFLIMMVGCRLRYMNRRLRYGRMKTNAHDADYLINGMYL